MNVLMSWSLQAARLHNRADKKKTLEARQDAEACRAERNDAKEELRRATLRLASWGSWWTSLSDGGRKKLQKVTQAGQISSGEWSAKRFYEKPSRVWSPSQQDALARIQKIFRTADANPLLADSRVCS